MEILYLLIPLALLFLALAIAAWVWAVRSGQYEDLEGPAWRILQDDPPARGARSNANESGSDG